MGPLTRTVYLSCVCFFALKDSNVFILSIVGEEREISTKYQLFFHLNTVNIIRRCCHYRMNSSLFKRQRLRVETGSWYRNFYNLSSESAFIIFVTTRGYRTDNFLLLISCYNNYYLCLKIFREKKEIHLYVFFIVNRK